VKLVLATVRAVNTADPGLYGGCVQQDCSLPQLVWVTIDTVHALPGKTVACLPRARNQAGCRLHAVLCDLVPGGIRKEVSAASSSR